MEPRPAPRRQRAMRMITTQLSVLLAGLALVVAACTPTSSVVAPSPRDITTAEGAADAVKESNPLVGGIGPVNPELIGQSDWWTAAPLDGGSPPEGWRVTFRVGWGDCPAGCIDEHTWTYDVTRDGTVGYVGETGTPLPAEVVQRLAAANTETGVGGWATAGPTCPVEIPGDPSCAPRPVEDAVLVVKAADGKDVGRLVTDGSGLFRAGLAPGDYVLEPQPVEGLMGTAAPMPFTVVEGAQTFLDVAYDTGIR